MVAATNGAEQIPTETIQDIVEELLEDCKGKGKEMKLKIMLMLLIASNHSLLAARYDDLDDLIRLASIGVSLDSKDSQGRTVFYLYHDKIGVYYLTRSCFTRGEKDAVACFEILNPFIALSFDLGGGVRPKAFCFLLYISSYEKACKSVVDASWAKPVLEKFLSFL
ncbi:ankyrin repeat-containing protein P16F5.05c [Gossypium australe]|uniref:Ankyrin repeat-containing protein P16F5.05c n=1 Tax=Gossypium australe TaxID=47621 RepID=A0A5B6ULM2_9ROSI|nr:ankyrin repeat-containing protein P16F5.05c [Gossypium australe]